MTLEIQNAVASTFAEQLNSTFRLRHGPATTELELVGTALNVWTWVPVAPWTHAPSGNPPSAIAGGYAIIDGSVMVGHHLFADGVDQQAAEQAWRSWLQGLVGSSGGDVPPG